MTDNSSNSNNSSAGAGADPLTTQSGGAAGADRLATPAGADAGVDPVTMQVVRYALEQVADEMGYTMVRTSRSTIIKEIMDITCAVFDAQGRTIAQAHHAPMLLTGFEITMTEILKRYGPHNLADGDVIISNDPYLGGQHIMDLQTFAPVFFEGEIVAWVGGIAHHTDMGGAVAGGVAGGLTEIYAEGICFPMVKLYRAHAESEEIFRIFERNIRVPDKTLGDVRAQASAMFVGCQRLGELFARYGVDQLNRCCAALNDYSERRIRAALVEIPDGTYTGIDYTDDDGRSDTPIKIQVNVHKKGDSVHVDFEGTAEQVKGNTNCPLATTYAAVYYALICVLDPHVPPNSGCYRPFSLDARPGSVLNPKMPSACAARTNTSQKVCEAMFKALAEPCPERVTAGSHGQIANNGFAGFDEKTGRRYVYIDIQGGGAGACATKDARDGQDSHLARFMNTPIEAAELEFPVRIERYEFLPDTGGAGRYRGGLALTREIRVLDEMTYAHYADRQRFSPWGTAGGLDGTPGSTWITRDGVKARLRSKGADDLLTGDVITLVTPGAGGYGDPQARPAEAVRDDVLDGKVSIGRARTDYGVALAPDGKLDEAATTAKRRAHAQNRATGN